MALQHNLFYEPSNNTDQKCNTKQIKRGKTNLKTMPCNIGLTAFKSGDSSDKYGTKHFITDRMYTSLHSAIKSHLFFSDQLNIGVIFKLVEPSQRDVLTIVDVDYPSNSKLVQQLIRYIPCLDFISSSGNAHLLIKLSNPYYQNFKNWQEQLNQCGYETRGILRDAAGQPVPSLNGKTPEIKMFGHGMHNASKGIKCNLGLDSSFKVNNVVDESLVNSYQNYLVDSYEALPIADSYISEVFRVNYPQNKPKAQPINSHNFKQSSTQYDFESNIKFLIRNYNSDFKGDSSAHIFKVAKWIAKLLLTQGNLSSQNVNTALHAVIPDFLSGKYSEKHPHGYSQQWINSTINNAVNKTCNGV